MSTSNSNQKKIHSLILDANPILRNDPPISTLLAQSQNLYSIPAVIDEIRDAEARSRIQTQLLPFLTLRTPKTASIKVITDFARRTGDLEVLSRPDLQILALAFELECERNEGDWRLRTLPGQKGINGAMPEGLGERHRVEALKVTEQAESGSRIETQPLLDEVTASDEQQLKVEKSSVETTEQKQSDAVAPDDKTLEQSMADASLETPEQSAASQTDPEELVDSDEEGWITPSNLKAHQEADANQSSTPLDEPKQMQVATITADYAMQNILLRMNLNLLAPSLQRIKTLKTYILRCHACFETSKDMSRQFCKKCGGATLLRTSCSTDATGAFKIHLKKNMQWNNRGNVFSIPKPVAGSSNGKRSIGGGQGGWGMGLILAEDQKEYVNAMTEEKRRKDRDLMDEDYLPNILSGDRRGPQGRIKVGGGRNVNSKKRH